MDKYTIVDYKEKGKGYWGRRVVDSDQNVVFEAEVQKIAHDAYDICTRNSTSEDLGAPVDHADNTRQANRKVNKLIKSALEKLANE